MTCGHTKTFLRGKMVAQNWTVTYSRFFGQNQLSRQRPGLELWLWVEFRSGYIWHCRSLSPAAAARGGDCRACSITRTPSGLQVLGPPFT